MIIKGASRSCVWWWAQHFENTEENERVTLAKSDGLVSDNILDLMREMQGHAQGTSCKNFMWIGVLNPGPNERLTEEGWEKAREILEKHRGYQGQPYFVVEHEKNGYVHRHLVMSRIDTENMRALPDGLDAKICHAAAREIEDQLGLQRVVGPFDREPGTPRPKRAPKNWEMYRGMTTKIDPRDITAEVTHLYQQSDSGKAFQAALEDHGYRLVTGRRGLLILDSAGKDHSLARRIDGVTAKELNAFMGDVDRQALPTLEQGKAQFQERKITGLEADRATVREEIQWQEALAKAAIDRERTEKRFVAPEDNYRQPSGSRERGEVGKSEPQRDFREAIRAATSRAHGVTNSRVIPEAKKAKEIRIPSIVTATPLRAAGKAADFVSDLFESFFSPKLTPEKIHKGEQAMREREADVQHTLDLSRFTTERQQDLQRREDQERNRQDRDRGGRDR